jgi:CheY-like chemotaxis protein
MGLGIKSLDTESEPIEDYRSRPADAEATIALGRLSAGLAHEINNAVTVLRNNTERISADARRFGQHAATEAVTRDSIKAVEVIADLTSALRAFAPEETRETATVDIVRIVEMVVASVRFYAKRGVDVVVSIPKNRQLMVTCRSHYLIKSLFLIFVELVEAALASSKMLHIDISLVPKETSILCGISVSAETFHIPTILLSQIQKDGVLARLVTRAGAKLGYNVDGNSLSLIIELQQAVFTKKRNTSMPLSGETSAKRGTILIVDDEPAIVRSIRRILEKKHDILAATSAGEALKIINSGRQIDILILDVFMPEISGIDLAKTLKKQSVALAQKIIFITGGSADREISEYMAESDTPVLEKPINIEVLHSTIEDMLTAF